MLSRNDGHFIKRVSLKGYSSFEMLNGAFHVSNDVSTYGRRGTKKKKRERQMYCLSSKGKNDP